MEDFRGSRHRLPQHVSWEEFGERKPGITEVHEDHEGEESFTFASIAFRRVRILLSHRGEAVLATRSWHLPPARLRQQVRWKSSEDWRARDFMAKVHHSIQEVALTIERLLASMSPSLKEDQMTLVLFRMSKNHRLMSTVRS